MVKRGDTSAVAIQQLLEERRKIEQWLQRLAMAADKTSEEVHTRVRTDYESRLADVVRELGTYRSDLKAALKTHKATRDGLRRQEKESSERLAEAELRHAVGEYTEAEWRDLKSEILETLVTVRESLADAEEEIEELDRVLQSLDSPPPEPDDEPELEVPPPPSEPASRAGGKPQTDAFGDELAFLKSVTAGEKATGGKRGGGGKATAARVQESQVEVEKQPVVESKPSVVNQRTLKCQECGTMNLPTEWYCERCGAELASL